jgi:hypothetical protein
MTHVCDQLFTKVKIEIDDPASVESKEDELEVTIAQIQFWLADVHIATMDLHEPHMMSSHNYAKMNTPGNHSLDFCDSNGHVCIKRRDNTICFTVSRFGGGGGGGIDIEMHADVCAPVFTALADWRRKYE